MGQLSAHFFFALKLPNETKDVFKKYRDYLQEVFPFSRWVHEQDYHITLAFLGRATEEQLELAQQKVSQEISGSKSFSLYIDHLGFFGREEAPRIFWAGVQEEPFLHSLRNQVFTACQNSGFKLETRPFHPHITLARKWQDEKPFSITTFELEKNLQNKIPFMASEVVLYETHLDKTPKYESIASFKLG
jgi:RNA 2',3'-cyclic 3'-phosphodiesterase